MAIGWKTQSFSDVRWARLTRVLALAVGLAFAGGAACSSTSSAPQDAGGSDAPDAADSAPDQAPTATCADGGTPTVAFSDDFSAGLNAGTWTVTQTLDGLFSFDDTTR